MELGERLYMIRSPTSRSLKETPMKYSSVVKVPNWGLHFLDPPGVWVVELQPERCHEGLVFVITEAPILSQVEP